MFICINIERFVYKYLEKKSKQKLIRKKYLLLYSNQKKKTKSILLLKLKFRLLKFFFFSICFWPMLGSFTGRKLLHEWDNFWFVFLQVVVIAYNWLCSGSNLIFKRTCGYRWHVVLKIKKKMLHLHFIFKLLLWNCMCIRLVLFFLSIYDILS